MQQLSESEILQLLVGQENLLQPLDNAITKPIRDARCPDCGQSGCAPVIDGARPFEPDLPLFRYFARCMACGCCFDPQTRLIRRAGSMVTAQAGQ